MLVSKREMDRGSITGRPLREWGVPYLTDFFRGFGDRERYEERSNWQWITTMPFADAPLGEGARVIAAVVNARVSGWGVGALQAKDDRDGCRQDSIVGMTIELHGTPSLTHSLPQSRLSQEAHVVVSARMDPTERGSIGVCAFECDGPQVSEECDGVGVNEE